MTDQPDKPTPPKLVWPPNCRDVTAENAGKMFAIIGAEQLRPRPTKDEAPAPAPSPAPPERK
jgi:hypothetical protein